MGGRERERERTQGRHKLSRPRTVSIWNDTASTRSASVRPLPWRSGQLRRQYTRYRERKTSLSFFLAHPLSLSLSRSLPRTFTHTPHLSKLAAAVLRVSAARFAPEPRARRRWRHRPADGRTCSSKEGNADSEARNYFSKFSKIHALNEWMDKIA